MYVLQNRTSYGSGCVFIRTDTKSHSFLNSQAYDGHMNLILSDVEETIMLVDGVEGAPPGQGVVNVSSTSSSTAIFVLM